MNKPAVQYAVDTIIHSQGHRVIRLPPYHCDLNPIELIWAQVKNNVASNNSTFTLENIKKLTDKALKAVTKEDWQKAIRHIEKQESMYWENDGILVTCNQDVIININESSTSSFSSSSLPSDSE